MAAVARVRGSTEGESIPDGLRHAPFDACDQTQHPQETFGPNAEAELLVLTNWGERH